MRYIDKTDKQSETAFNAIVNPYVASGRYRYDDLTESDRINLRKIVADEQDWMCAYCMRKLSQATSDHVIPKYIDEARYGKALKHMGEGLYRKDFIYDKKYTPHAVGHYYPHSLAYGNFVCACEECNSTKDNELIRPAFFKNPPTHLSYNEKGLVTFTPSDTFPTQLKSRLNNDRYITIRRIWRAIKLAGISVEDVENANNEEIRKELFDRLPALMGMENKIHLFSALSESFYPDSTWKQLLSFKWFWNCY